MLRDEYWFQAIFWEALSYFMFTYGFKPPMHKRRMYCTVKNFGGKKNFGELGKLQ